MLLAAKKLTVIFLLIIYLAVTMNFVLTYSAHFIHHLLTHTLHQHHDHDHYNMHSHFSSDHHHDHNHSLTLDYAIREVSSENNKNEHPATPSNRLEIKFSAHHLIEGSTLASINPDYQKLIRSYIVNYKSPILIPPVPPPRLRA